MATVQIESPRITPSGRWIWFRATADGADTDVIAINAAPTIRVNGLPVTAEGPVWSDENAYVAYRLPSAVTGSDAVTVTAPAGWATTAAGSAPALTDAAADSSAIAAGTSLPDPPTPTMPVGMNIIEDQRYLPGAKFANLRRRAGGPWITSGSGTDLTFAADGYISDMGGYDYAQVGIAENLDNFQDDGGYVVLPDGTYTLMWDGPIDGCALAGAGDTAVNGTVVEQTYPVDLALPSFPGSPTGANFTGAGRLVNDSNSRDPLGPHLSGSDCTIAFKAIYTGASIEQALSIGTGQGSGAWDLRVHIRNKFAELTIVPSTGTQAQRWANPGDGDWNGQAIDPPWMSVILEVDNTAKTITVSVQSQGASAPDVRSTSFTGDFEAVGDLVVGAWPDGSGAWNGRMNALGFWSRKLTAAEKAWYHTGAGQSNPLYADLGAAGTDGANLTTGLAAWYDLTESSGTRADSGPNGLDLSVVGTVGSGDGYFAPVYPGTPIDADNTATYTITKGSRRSASFYYRQFKAGVSNVRIWPPGVATDGSQGFWHPDWLRMLGIAQGLRNLACPPGNSNPVREVSHLMSSDRFSYATRHWTDLTITAAEPGDRRDNYFAPGEAYVKFTCSGPHGMVTGTTLSIVDPADSGAEVYMLMAGGPASVSTVEPDAGGILVTTSAAHALKDGKWAVLSGLSDVDLDGGGTHDLNGTHRVTGVPSATTFVIDPDVTLAAGTQSPGGTAEPAQRIVGFNQAFVDPAEPDAFYTRFNYPDDVQPKAGSQPVAARLKVGAAMVWEPSLFLDLCTAAGSDTAWVCVPYLADDDLADHYGDAIADWLAADSSRVVYAEDGNEPWNAQFIAFNQHFHYVGMARRANVAAPGTYDSSDLRGGLEYYADDAHRLISRVKARCDLQGVGSRLRPVLGSFVANTLYTDWMLARAQSEGVLSFWKAVGIAPYWEGGPGLSDFGAIYDDISIDEAIDLTELNLMHGPILRHAGDVRSKIDEYGTDIELVAYEESPEYFGFTSALPTLAEREALLGRRSRNVSVHPRMLGMQRYIHGGLQAAGVGHCFAFLAVGNFGTKVNVKGPSGQNEPVRGSTTYNTFLGYGQLPGTGDGTDGLFDNRTDLDDFAQVVSPRARSIEDWNAALASPPPPQDQGKGVSKKRLTPGQMRRNQRLSSSVSGLRPSRKRSGR